LLAGEDAMAKDPRTQQRTDAPRIGHTGSGKLDATGPPRPRRRRPAAVRAPDRERLRARLLSERQAAVDELARLGIAPEISERTGTVESPFEEGDAAQASERNDMGFAHRQRVAERIKRLTHALERLARGEYETCESCGRPIEPARLAALPEVTLCRECQERRERGQAA
jgi:RNA polymerase-binding transcription factor